MAEQERTPKVLIVDDDPRLRDLLRRYLGDNGFSVSVADGAPAMNRIWMRERFDALILDLMLPGEDGLQILRRLRASKDMTPVLMLTARGEDVDRIVGLELGADDYIAKPFNPRELLARIHAVLRRRPRADEPGAPSLDKEVVVFGEFELDLGRRELRKNGETVSLTTGEFAVLKAFARHPRVPVPRQAHGNGTRPRIRSLRPFARRSGEPSAQAHRTRSEQAALPADGLGIGLRLHSGRSSGRQQGLIFVSAQPEAISGILLRQPFSLFAAATMRKPFS